MKSTGDVREIIDQLRARIAELEAEIYRARTDSTYWSEFNTVSTNRCVCDKCGQPHDPKLHGDGIGEARKATRREG